MRMDFLTGTGIRYKICAPCGTSKRCSRTDATGPGWPRRRSGVGEESDRMAHCCIWGSSETRARVVDVRGGLVQLYMGAMEIPMLVLRPATPVTPAAERLATWQPILDRVGLVLDCVTPDGNCKLNRPDSGEYVGRILPDALKFHAGRVIDLGPEGLEALCRAYLALPSAPGS